MDEFIYLKSDKSKLLFDEFSYVKYRDVDTLGETTYRCNQCKCVCLKTKLTDTGEREVSKPGKHKNTCKRMLLKLILVCNFSYFFCLH